ncbi:TatD family hydrolase [Oribacterium sp. WCC10]|uniref:TatD family hydrolase n=1 Tax=Oribacterium sp. WCC10 TaxID=1855343 RepID=UPI0008E895C7|nr:TatD family hydrolase [Oribacterium sp. WCC10]SFG12916.1 TatD DNase family protein [Oribacterium sp. WCC10]
MIDGKKIFDTHAHLNDESFDTDRNEVIMALNLSGVSAFTEIGFDMPSSRKAIELAETYDDVYATVGFHPDHSDMCTDSDIMEIRTMVERDKGRACGDEKNLRKIVAIGEIGLDYHYTRAGIIESALKEGREPDPADLEKADPEPEIQKDTFSRMLKLAVELGMPINVHSRDAAKDTYDYIVSHHGYANGGVIHCFSYSLEMAKLYVKLGMCIGIGGVITFKNSKKIKEVVENIPIDNIVLETDCPYMAPIPLRGTRNDPRNLRFVVDKVAELKDMSPDDVIRITTENAKRVYRINM